jgi:hypothetical protein
MRMRRALGLFAVALLAGPAVSGDFVVPPPAEFLQFAGQGDVPALPPPEPLSALRAVLNSAPFKGKRPADTRANAEKFAAGLGLTMTRYQDNEAIGSMRVSPELGEATPLGRVQRALLLRTARERLERLSVVRKVAEEGDGSLTVTFARPLYEDEAAVVAERLPEGVVARLRRNPVKTGLFVLFALPPGADAGGVAASLAAAHPKEIAACAANPSK